MKKLALLAALAVLMLLPAARAHTREEIRAAYRAITEPTDASPYAAEPVVTPPYQAGDLTEAARADALAWLNYMRWLAGVGPVSESVIYDYQCQHGATLLAALDYVDHNAPNPGNMDGDFYDSAHLATTSSSIAKLAWMRPTILRDGIAYFLRDDGESNLTVLGHRRWALNPMMSATGFGLANSRSGASYVVMYAHDLGNRDVDWDTVCWPAAGAFPATLMHANLAWSITLNPYRYDVAGSQPVVTLAEPSLGLSFRFYPRTGGGDGSCALNLEGYGPGPCLIFRPDFDEGFTDYQQNQRWVVRVEGLLDAGGNDAPIEYAVEMASLHAEDVAAVELSALEAVLAPGETLRLEARVVPDYADDLSVTWRSTDPAVASVDGDGLVIALAPGRCEIVAASVNGREDACALTVQAP